VATEKGGEDSGMADGIVPNNILIYAKIETEHISPAEQARSKASHHCRPLGLPTALKGASRKS
jgi:hypothetical protein